MNSLSARLKPLSHLLLSLSSPSSRILCVSLFSTSSSSSNHSFSSSSNSYSSPSRRHDEESRNVRVSVWWDIENCSVPTGINVFNISQSITAAVRVNGIKGPIQISAFGDVCRLSKPILEALSVTGINIIHVPIGGKNSADRSIIIDLMYWVSQNPPPAHIFLISGDKDFAGVLHRLRMNNYNILLAGIPNDTSAVLCSASSIMWNWSELARGENLSGKHFNQPPDGPFNSWYGQYRGPLEDPFKLAAQQSSSKANDLSDEEISSDKIHPIPNAVLQQICRIVHSYPRGVSITELRAQLAKSQVNFDRDFYGYKKFSRLLQSIPHIVKAIPIADGQFILRPVSSKVRKPAESDDTAEGFMTENGIQDVQMNTKACDETHSISRVTEIEPMLPVSSYNDVREKAVEEKVDETTGKVSDTPLREDQDASTKKLLLEVLNAQVAKGRKAEETSEKLLGSLTEDKVKSPVAPPEQNPKNEMGLFKRLWTTWFTGSTDFEKTKHNGTDEFHASSSSLERLTSEEGSSKSTTQHEIHTPSLSSSSVASSMDAKNSIINKSKVSEGMVAKVMSWFRPWKNELTVNPTEPFCQEPSLIEDSRKHEDGKNARKHELLSDESLWSAIESFLKTYSGSHILQKSTSREDFAKRLQNSGLLVVQSLQESDLLHLVDLLVSKKKWVREFPSEIPRFRIVLPRERSSVSAPNGLSSIVSSSSHENHPLGVSPIVQKKPSEKTRVEILGDCKKLLDGLLKQHPEGFTVGCFRKQFIKAYGYSLDYQKLGYPKLASFLQIMMGVKIESGKILPHSVLYAPGIQFLGSEAKSSGSDVAMSDLPQKHEDIESPWEELGPVTENSNLSEQEEGSKQETVNNVYEPCVSEDDEFSDLEEESPPFCTKAVEASRSRVNEDESSLLNILDSWYSSKDKSSPSAHTSDLVNPEDLPNKENRTSGSSHINDKDEVSTAAYHAQKQTPKKSYTYVSDSEQNHRV